MVAIVEVRSVTKVYGRDAHQTTPLRNVSVSIARGEFLALVGPSGSGKTTLLNLIAGIDRPTCGTIVFEGTDLATMKDPALARWRRRHVGYIFQSYNLIPVLTAYENVELPLLLLGLSADRRAQQARSALSIVGLGDRVTYYPRQLSGGQEQRVAIARAMVTDPSVLVADEPTGDLDGQSAADILGLLQRLNREFEKTVIMVTHDPRAVAYATTVRRLDKGQLADESPVPARGQA
jgi:putative ABC transport system ATP-binding protein